MRFVDWEQRLNNVVNEYMLKPFEWGVSDCCMFAADCVAAMTGIDYAKGIRNTYTNIEEARQRINEVYSVTGVDDIPNAVGLQEIGCTKAMRGDIVAYETKYGPALGVCYGRYALFKSDIGLQSVAMNRVQKSWRVC